MIIVTLCLRQTLGWIHFVRAASHEVKLHAERQKPGILYTCREGCFLGMCPGFKIVYSLSPEDRQDYYSVKPALCFTESFCKLSYYLFKIIYWAQHSYSKQTGQWLVCPLIQLNVIILINKTSFSYRWLFIFRNHTCKCFDMRKFYPRASCNRCCLTSTTSLSHSSVNVFLQDHKSPLSSLVCICVCACLFSSHCASWVHVCALMHT